MKSRFTKILILILLCALSDVAFAKNTDERISDTLEAESVAPNDTISQMRVQINSLKTDLESKNGLIQAEKRKNTVFLIWAIVVTVAVVLCVVFILWTKKKKSAEKCEQEQPLSDPIGTDTVGSTPIDTPTDDDVNEIKTELGKANAKVEGLEKTIGELTGENQKLKEELQTKDFQIQNLSNPNNIRKESSSSKVSKELEKDFVISLKKHLRNEYDVKEDSVDEIVGGKLISKLIAVIIKSFISKKTSKLSEIVGTLPNDIEKQINLIEDGIKRLLKEKKETEEHPCKYISNKYPSLDKEEKEILSSLVVRILSGKITGLKQYEGKSFQELADAIQAAMTRKSDEDVIADALSKGDIVRKDDMANAICQQINELVKIDSLALAAKSVEELVNCVSEKLQQNVDQVEIDKIAEERAKLQIEQSKKDSTTQIASLTKQLGDAKKDVENLAYEKDQLTKSVQEAKDELMQAKNSFNEEKAQLQQNHQKELDERKNTYENNKRQLEEKHESEKKQLIEQHSSDIQKLNQEHELTLSMEQEKATAEKEKALKELAQAKDAEISKVTAEKEAKATELEKEKGEHSQTKESLELAMAGYAALIKNTFEQLNNTIAKAEKDSDDSASKLVSKIVDNKAYGLEEFMEAISKISGKDTEVDFATYNSELKNCVLECLETKQPTWIDWLVRLSQYSNVPFIAEQFAQQDLSLVGVGEALQATKTILHSLGIQLEYPMLFKDTISDKYGEESIRNIDSYVNDIASHCSGQKGLIIDLYKAGYSVDGEQKRKPIVSKFN